jgi:hypothetical protein
MMSAGDYRTHEFGDSILIERSPSSFACRDREPAFALDLSA